MKEIDLINELEKIENDDVYVRKALELSDQDSQNTVEFYKKERIDLLQNSIAKYKTWNKSAESGVPLRFHECSFDNFECHSQIENNRKQTVIDFVERENNDGVLLMTGDKGTGKTHLGAAAVRAMLGHYVTMEDLIYRIESSLNFKSPMTEEQVFLDYSTRKFLVIDEVGRSIKSEKETELLSYILRKRYDNQLPTIVISNLDKKSLLKKLGEAVVDRLREVATSIEFSGESYRILKRKIPDAA